MPQEPGGSAPPAEGRLKLGIVFYTPPSTSHFTLGIELAKAALRRGYDVQAFAWGDSVYATNVSDEGKAIEGSAPSEIARLIGEVGSGGPRFTISACTSCRKLRGMSQGNAVPGVRLGGLHDVVKMSQECHRMLVLVP